MSQFTGTLTMRCLRGACLLVLAATMTSSKAHGAKAADPLPPEAAGLERRQAPNVPNIPGVPKVPGMQQMPGGFEQGPTRNSSSPAGSGSSGPDDSFGTRSQPGFTSGQRGGGRDQVYGPINGGQNLNARGLGLGPSVQGGFEQIQPEFHIVDDGDTLWGICTEYFRDPYRWPEVWALNPQVTNAHWIFPGDRVRLFDSDKFAGAGDGSNGSPFISESRRSKGRRLPAEVLVNRYAILFDEQRHSGMKIVGAGQAKVMMATGDRVYVGYDRRNPPIPGERLTVYRAPEKLHRYRRTRWGTLQRGRRIGHLAEIVGEVSIDRVGAKSAEATVVESVRPLERGMIVGELAARFLRVAPNFADGEIDASIIATLRGADMIGEDQFVVLDVGSEGGVEVGHVLEIVHRGDAYTKHRPLTPPNTEGHPPRLVGKLLVVQTQSRTSLALVMESRMELTRGDRVSAGQSGEGELLLSSESLRSSKTGP